MLKIRIYHFIECYLKYIFCVWLCVYVSMVLSFCLGVCVSVFLHKKPFLLNKTNLISVSCKVKFTVANPRSKYNFINLSKPTGYVMHQQFNIQHCTFCPHCIYMFCIYLRTNSHLCHLQHKLIGFYNRDEKCLLRGTNWVFK